MPGGQAAIRCKQAAGDQVGGQLRVGQHGREAATRPGRDAACIRAIVAGVDGGGETRRAGSLKDALRGLTGGDSAADAVAERRCLRPPIGCGRELDPATYLFRDRASVKEWTITGLCQDCQDTVEAAE